MNDCKCAGGSLLCEALTLIDGNRHDSYGDFGAEAVKLAAGFSALVGCDVSPDSVPLMLMWLKMVRESHKHKRDNLVDLVGYAELLARMNSDGLTAFVPEEVAELPSAADGMYEESAATPFTNYYCAPCKWTTARSTSCSKCGSSGESAPLDASGDWVAQAFAGYYNEGGGAAGNPRIKLRKTRVYIAGPYTLGNKQANTNAALQAAAELIKLGYWAYPPHWTHYLDLICPQDHDFWMEYDRPLLTFCDAVLRLEGKSVGADVEVAQATFECKPVYKTIESLKDNLPVKM